MAKLQFTAPLTAVGPKGAWTMLLLTKEQSEKLGSRGIVPVTGSINGFPIRTSVSPMGDGTHAMMVNKSMQAGAKAKPGETVKVVLEVDTKSRKVSVPADLKKALSGNAAARSAFARLAYSHQKEYVDWITEAKRPETRARRIAQAVEMATAGKKRK